MAQRILLTLLTVFTEALSPVQANDPENPERVHRINLKEYEATLAFWVARYPQQLQVERIG